MRLLTLIVIGAISYYAYNEYNKKEIVQPQQNVTEIKPVHYNNPSIGVGPVSKETGHKYPHEKVYNPKMWQDNEILNGAFASSNNNKHFQTQVIKPHFATY